MKRLNTHLNRIVSCWLVKPAMLSDGLATQLHRLLTSNPAPAVLAWSSDGLSVVIKTPAGVGGVLAAHGLAGRAAPRTFTWLRKTLLTLGFKPRSGGAASSPASAYSASASKGSNGREHWQVFRHASFRRGEPAAAAAIDKAAAAKRERAIAQGSSGGGGGGGTAVGHDDDEDDDGRALQ